MAELSITIKASGNRTKLAQILAGVSGIIDEEGDGVSVDFDSQVSNHSGPPPVEAVALADLLGEDSSRNARKAVTVLAKYSDIRWVSQVLEMSEEDILDCFYFGDILLPEFRALLNQAGYQW